MDFLKCLYKDCPHLYRRKIKRNVDYMCCARKGRKTSRYDLGSGRLINILRLRQCPLEEKQRDYGKDDM
ncbi:MAG: hypothetical protein IJ504_00835 [Bacteroidales bacterium]|nr:hypothetical protein [Bacteroidales bacterium]